MTFLPALLLCALQATEDLPQVPAGFEIRVFARDPQIRNPAALTFDARGRVFVGQGPQWRTPTPDTPGDSVLLLLDEDGDGVCDRVRTFAAGFNSIQGLAWRGRDLWVANAPDLTVVRDLDGDDEADEYILVYTDLGNLEHSLHGLHWAPDGKLYMSKGNSKGVNRADRYAPAAFRDLLGLPAPPGADDLPPPRRFTKDTYRKTYHPPEDDWGREGGILRCDDMGKNLEIVSRGLRNPWDHAFDDGFDWIAVDQDQTTGDRIVAPFAGAHFGWGHPWSFSWTGEDHPPTVPVSGPLFEGSGTGVAFTGEDFPEPYRKVFLVGDWLQRRIHVFRPGWSGALRLGGPLETFAKAGSARTMRESGGVLFEPTDLEIGPDGALWVLSWGRSYGAVWKDGTQTNEGRVYRIFPKGRKPVAPAEPPGTIDGLIDDLRPERVAARRTFAQEELLRLGAPAREALAARLDRGGLSKGQETWIAWTLGRFASQDRAIDERFARTALDAGASLNLRIQAVRILAHRVRRGLSPDFLDRAAVPLLRAVEPRLRFESILALAQAERRGALPSIRELAAVETDRLCAYAAWKALQTLSGLEGLRSMLADPRPGVRRAALLGLLDAGALSADEAKRHADEPIVTLWRRKTGAERPHLVIEPPGGAFAAPVRVQLSTPLKGVVIHYTLDGSSPTDSSPRYRGPIVIERDVTLRAAVLRDRVPDGPILTARYQVGFGTQTSLWSDLRGLEASLEPVRTGLPIFADRNFILREFPDFLAGAALLRTRNGASRARGQGAPGFRLLQPALVHVAHDERIARMPGWLSAFEPLPAFVATSDARYRLYRKTFPAGEVVLGENTVDGSADGEANYLVFIEAAGLLPRATPTLIDQALAALPTADPRRGRDLFFGTRGAGCWKCHRAEGRGNAFGPDLTNIRDRADARFVLQSILEPSAQITTGYASIHVRTTAGDDVVGFLVEESGVELRLATSDGSVVGIPKARIERRRTLQESAMPSNYSHLLSPEDAAALAAFLLQERRPSGSGFSFERKGHAVGILWNGAPTGEFVHGDPATPRPFLANLREPGGRWVTRPHPAGPGADHALLHPGAWISFGDVNGRDFWRLKARATPVSLDVHDDGFTAVTRMEDVCTETLRVRVVARPQGTLFILDAKYRSETGSFSFGDQEEMGFGVRVPPELAEKTGGGTIRDAEGRTGEKAVWGNTAAWCAYAGAGGGLLIMPDPGNFAPSRYHARAYGVLVANPFGRKCFGKGPERRVEVARGEDLRLRFGLLVFAGLPDASGEYAAFLKEIERAERP